MNRISLKGCNHLPYNTDSHIHGAIHGGKLFLQSIQYGHVSVADDPTFSIQYWYTGKSKNEMELFSLKM
jgi:hypothetical protein